MQKIKTIIPDPLETIVVETPIWACVIIGIVGGLALGVLFILVLG